MKDKGQGVGSGSGVQTAGAASPACGRTWEGGGCTSRGFPGPETANLHPKYKKLIFVESVLNYLQVADTT